VVVATAFLKETAMTTATLTPREWEVANLIAQGLTNDEIAERLGMSIHTCRAHLREMMLKLDLHNRTKLARWVLTEAR
jgi:DNA-binding NarL/FixJ family response regulator